MGAVSCIQRCLLLTAHLCFGSFSHSHSLSLTLTHYTHSLHSLSHAHYTHSLSLFPCSTARNVKLEDKGFDAENSGFTRVSGLSTVSFDAIEAGANVTHSVVVTASVAGFYNMSAAQVSYFAAEGDDEAQVRTKRDVENVNHYEYNTVGQNTALYTNSIRVRSLDRRTER